MFAVANCLFCVYALRSAAVGADALDVLVSEMTAAGANDMAIILAGSGNCDNILCCSQYLVCKTETLRSIQN